MKILLSDEQKKKNPSSLLREAGYAQEVHRGTGQVSFVRRAAGGDFPRFHIYVDEIGSGWQINLHLDQKAPSYGGTSAHAGEYDGEVVEEEGERLKSKFK